MLVPNTDKPRYRTRMGQISTNTLVVYDRYMGFVYVLPGREGSTADSRVLRDAVNRVHGLRVRKGNLRYHTPIAPHSVGLHNFLNIWSLENFCFILWHEYRELLLVRHANNDGFLTSYKVVRYHLKDWGPTVETTPLCLHSQFLPTAGHHSLFCGLHSN